MLGLAFFFAGRTSFWLILAMSLLILAVGWAYTQICRIYPDGGGVYTAAKQHEPHARGRRRAAALRRLHRHRQPQRARRVSLLRPAARTTTQVDRRARPPSDARQRRPTPAPPSIVDASTRRSSQSHESLFAWDSPGLWAIVAIAVIGTVQPDGPEAHRRLRDLRGRRDGGHHAADHRVRAAAGAVAELPHRIPSHRRRSELSRRDLWVAFVSIVLALSGVEAIANLTGVMKKPVAHTARKAIWVVAAEVAIFNVLLALLHARDLPAQSRRSTQRTCSRS